MQRFIVDLEIVEINEMPVMQEVEKLDETEDIPAIDNNLPGYHLFVKAYLGEQEIELVVDTGASKSVFDPTLLQDHIELDEKNDAIQSMSVNSELEIGFGHIRSFRIGEIEKKNLSVGFTSLAAVNQMYETVIGKKIWGLLGSDFMMAHNAIIDYEKSQMSLTLENGKD